MKVHITSTSEVDSKIVNEVIYCLSSTKGPIVFNRIDSIANETIENVIGPFQNYQPLDHEVFFNLCNQYRALKGINYEEYIVVFTSLRNKGLWFSSFQNKNIFIDINEWQSLSSTPLKYALSYQVVGNLFHSLNGIDPNNFKNDPNVHNISIGCISDYCENKSEILLKFRTGYICRVCLESIATNVEDKNIVIQIHEIIQFLRTQFIDFDFTKVINTPKNLQIDQNLDLYIDNQKIELEPLRKTLYYYFLLNPNGVESAIFRKEDVYKLLVLIFSKLKGPSADLKPVKRLCSKEQNTGVRSNNVPKSSFTEVKSHLNKDLIMKIQKTLSHPYLISNTKDRNSKNSKFKIELDAEYINIEVLKKFIVQSK